MIRTTLLLNHKKHSSCDRYNSTTTTTNNNNDHKHDQQHPSRRNRRQRRGGEGICKNEYDNDISCGSGIILSSIITTCVIAMMMMTYSSCLPSVVAFQCSIRPTSSSSLHLISSFINDQKQRKQQQQVPTKQGQYRQWKRSSDYTHVTFLTTSTATATSLSPESVSSLLPIDLALSASSIDIVDDTVMIENSPMTMSSIEASALTSNTVNIHISNKTALSMSLPELTEYMNGYGRAKLIWDCYRYGIDPIIYYSNSSNSNTNINTNDPIESFQATTTITPTFKFPSNRRTQKLGYDSLQRLSQMYQNYYTIHQNMYKKITNDTTTNYNNNILSNTNDNTSSLSSFTSLSDSIAQITHVSQSKDGTTKLLITLLSDMSQIETVIIPFYNSNNHDHDQDDEINSATTSTNSSISSNLGRSTICISSQVGCQQACTFCATGTMGKIRSLTSDEIIIQLLYAQSIIYHTQQNIQFHVQQELPPITNVVFMGMGEPSDNAEAVITATKQFTTRELYQLSASKVTVSTVAPTPRSFMQFVDAPCVIAWSVHAVNDTLRKRLVPTTRYTMHELRQGLIDTLLLRPLNYLRTTMIEVVLIDHINDSIEHAEDMAIFVRGIVDAVPGCKLMVNLIPYNEINSNTDSSNILSKSNQLLSSVYRKPSMERVLQYQQHLWSRGVYAPVRVTRGDDESAACGQLVTSSMASKKKRSIITI